MKRLLIVLMCLELVGCATAGSINKYYERINYSDGINEDEAKLIGKKQLIESGYQHYYQIISPYVSNTESAKKYPDYWFVHFYPKSLKVIVTNYLVVVDKKAGKVLFADSYYAGKVPGYDWIFKGEKWPISDFQTR